MGSVLGLLGGAAGYLIGGPAGATLGAQIGGGMDANQANADAAASAQSFSAQQYATRYQTTVADMEAAGLSPMLAYSQGAGSPPTGVSWQNQNVMQGVPQAYNTSQLTDPQVAATQAQAASSTASAGQSVAQTELIKSTTAKVDQELSNLKTDNDRVVAVIDNLRVERQNLVKQGYNLTEQGNQIRATIQNLDVQSDNFATLVRSNGFQAAINEAESKLRNYDVQAAAGAGNIGREYSQVKPIIDLLRSFIRK